jgi:hypothetical protein
MEIDRSAATAPMRRALAALLGLFFLFLAAPAEAAEAPIRKIAVTSLIGDSLTVDTYRRRTSSHIESNMQNIVPSGTTAFDLAALAAARSALSDAVPSAEIALLAVPAADSDLDPARALVDGKTVVPTGALVAALRREAFTHVLLIVKHRALAHLQLDGLTVGNGQLRGLGFYIDNDLPTYLATTRETARGFIAPYVYVRLWLVDVASLQVVGEKEVTASTTRANFSGLSPWDAMTSEAKIALLTDMVRESVGAAATPLLRANAAGAPR